ncbi:MAG: sulfatase [Chthoniobacter sp.]|nr:sulfatase [Chthoniobacter sp.]
MKLRVLLPTFAFAYAIVAGGASPKKPNVLFIAVDDLKPVLGCYGDKMVKSPNIDRLAARGMIFERAYCNQAVCSPSRNALMTGRRPQSLGIYDLGTNFRKAAPDTITLAQHFQKAGYRTEALGKIFHVGHGNREDAASWSVPHFQAKSVAYVLPESRANQGLTREEALFSNANTPVDKLPRGAAYESADVSDSSYPDGVLADEAIRRLKAAKANPDEPWLIAVGFLKPHLPFCAPKKYWDLYDPAAFQLPTSQTPPEGAPKFAPTNWGELRQYSDTPTSGPLNPDQARTLIHGYHAAISYMDAQLGRVMAALDELDPAKETIIVLWGDHGWHLGDHGQWCKHSNYEQAVRTPLLVAGPGVKSGTRTMSLVESVDVYPTLSELAGLPAPTDCDGKSFLSILRDPAASTRDSIIHVYPRGELLGRAIRTERHRLVEWKRPGSAPDTAVLELYDYEADPAETRNLATEQREVVSRLQAILALHPEAKPQISGDGKPAQPRPDRATMFARRDKDSDGKLTRDEFLIDQPDPGPAAKRWEQFDTNKDGMLSRDEFIHMGGPKQ